MHRFRLLSTKCLSVDHKSRLLQTGASYSCWDFISTSPKDFDAEIGKKSLIFTSQNAVKAVFNKYAFDGNKCYCVGEKTKLLLERNGQKVIKMTQNAALLVDFIFKNAQKESFLFFTGNQRMPEIETAFQQNNKALTLIETYTTHLQPKAMGEYEAALFFSPSGVESFSQNNRFEKTTCFAIGETTAAALQKYTNNIITATQPTIEHLIVAVRKYMNTLV